jgi:glucose/arabinose dehydrogenase
MKPGRPRLLSTLGLIAASWLAAAPAQAADYKTEGRCEGFPKVQIGAPAGYCVGLVADERQGLKFPRRMLQVAPGRFWLVDMGGWDAGRGRLLELDITPGAVKVKVLASKLDRPHGLALGPDGKAYIGEATRIWRSSTSRFAPETVISGLPGDGAHPLKELAFGSGGWLYINVGSFSDACRNDAQKQPAPCPEVVGPQPRAAVYQALLAGPDWHLASLKPFATGLRNSLALTVYRPPGKPDVVLQGENSIDYPQADAPQEEFNILTAGGHYGWPYCLENQQAAHGYEKRFDCQRTRTPSQLWPAHSAPLQMLVAPTGLSQPWAGKLLVAWHGYRPVGQRVMAFPVDTTGKITGKGTQILGNWAAKPGIRPLGAPTGLTLDTGGRLFVLEDRNHTILVLGRDK